MHLRGLLQGEPEPIIKYLAEEIHLTIFKRNATQFVFTCNVGSRRRTCFMLRPYVTPVSEPCYSTVCPQVSTPHGWLPMDKICPARASSARSSLQRPTSLTITTHCWSCSGDSSWIMISHTRPSVGVSSIGPPWVKTLSLGMNLQEKFRCVWPGQNALDQSAVVSCAWELIQLFAVAPCLVRPVHTFYFIFLYFQLDTLFFCLCTISAILLSLHVSGLTGPSSGGLNCTCSIWYSPPLQVSLLCGR